MTEPTPPASGRAAVLGRLDAVPSATAAERAGGRHRRIAAATVAGLVSRVLSAAVLLVSLPAAATHLNRAELGVWALLVTALALVGFADFGLGNGMLNVLTDALGTDDARTAGQAVTAAMAGLGVVALAGMIVIPVVLAIVPWYDLFGVTSAEVPQLQTTIAVFAAIAMIAILGGVGQRIHMAYQQGWAASLTSSLGSLFALAAVVVAAVTDASLPWWVAAVLGGPALAYVGESVWVLGWTHRDLRPRRDRFDPTVLRRVARSGLLFFVLTGAAAVAFQSDTLVVAQALGAAEVTRYAVSLRLFTLVPTALAALLLPLWPAYGEAIARHDNGWVRATFHRSVVLTGAVTLASSGFLLLAGRAILRVWVPTTQAPSSNLLISMAIWAVLVAVSMAVAMYLNGANIIGFQVITAISMATINLGLSIAFVRWFGISGPVWASIGAQACVVLVPSLLLIRHRLARADLESRL